MESFKQFAEKSNTIPDSAIIDDIELGNGEKFVVVSRNAKGKEDKVSMYIVDKSNKIKYDLGSHTNAKAAIKFGKTHSKNKFKDVIV